MKFVLCLFLPVLLFLPISLMILYAALFVLFTQSAVESAPLDALNFLLVGDWGGQSSSPYTTPAQTAVAKVMGTEAAKIGSQFTFALGDNFYEFGVKDVNDKRFNETFEDVFTASSLQNRWYVVCGNHDHYGNCSAEIAYTKMSNRWYFPDYYYKQEFPIPGSSSMLKVVFIDTVLLAGLTDHDIPAFPPKAPKSIKMAEDQWAWINSTLAEYSKTDGWTIVAGHYPVWSVAEHGPTKTLVERLKPMLEQYGVAAYYCGHDHNLQHLTDKPLEYYVIGAGHLIDPSHSHENDVPKDSLQFYYGPSTNSKSKGGFASVSVTESTITTTYFDYTGVQVYQHMIKKS